MRLWRLYMLMRWTCRTLPSNALCSIECDLISILAMLIQLISMQDAATHTGIRFVQVILTDPCRFLLSAYELGSWNAVDPVEASLQHHHGTESGLAPNGIFSGSRHLGYGQTRNLTTQREPEFTK